jgi:hypothetical protein
MGAEATYGIHVASERALQEEEVRKFTESTLKRFEKRGTDDNDQKDWRFSSDGGN